MLKKRQTPFQILIQKQKIQKIRKNKSHPQSITTHINPFLNPINTSPYSSKYYQYQTLNLSPNHSFIINASHLIHQQKKKKKIILRNFKHPLLQKYKKNSNLKFLSSDISLNVQSFQQNIKNIKRPFSQQNNNLQNIRSFSPIIHRKYQNFINFFNDNQEQKKELIIENSPKQKIQINVQNIIDKKINAKSQEAVIEKKIELGSNFSKGSEIDNTEQSYYKLSNLYNQKYNSKVLKNDKFSIKISPRKLIKSKITIKKTEQLQPWLNPICQQFNLWEKYKFK